MIFLMWTTVLIAEGMTIDEAITALGKARFPIEKFCLTSRMYEREEGFTDWLWALQYTRNARTWGEDEKHEIFLLLFTIGLLQPWEKPFQSIVFEKLPTKDLPELQARLGGTLPDFLQKPSPQHIFFGSDSGPDDDSSDPEIIGASAEVSESDSDPNVSERARVGPKGKVRVGSPLSSHRKNKRPRL